MVNNQTTIEWIVDKERKPGFTWNFASGCINKCFYCYAEKMIKRFPKVYPYGFQPTYSLTRMMSDKEIIIRKKKATTILLGSMGDYFASCKWMDKDNKKISDINLGIEALTICEIINQERIVKYLPQHTFLFLTKNPEGYRRCLDWLKSTSKLWLTNKENLWFGSTIESNFLVKDMQRVEILNELKREYGINTFISYEPMLDFNDIYTYQLEDVDWVIMGALNKGGHPDFLNIDMVQAIQCIKVVNENIFIKDSIVKNIDSTNCDGSSLINSYPRSEINQIKEMRYIPWIKKQQ
jgi:protein gp37